MRTIIFGLLLACVVLVGCLPDSKCQCRPPGCHCGPGCDCPCPPGGCDCPPGCCRPPRVMPRVQERLQASTVMIQTGDDYGSGVLMERGGRVYIVTAAHVARLSPSGSFTVTLQDGRHVPAHTKVIGAIDVAILSTCLPLESVTVAVFFEGDSQVGDDTFSVASIYGHQGSVGRGIVSYVGREVDGNIFDQTTAPGAGGSSGGIITNLQGEVLGIISQGHPPAVVFYTPTWKVREFLTSNSIGCLGRKS